MSKVITCSTCNIKEDRLVTDVVSGEIVCSNCGTVVIDGIEEIGKEWINPKDHETDKSRIGMPFSLAVHDMNLSTIIGKTNKDSAGQLIDSGMQARMNRLRIWDSRTMYRDSSSRNFTTAFVLLGKLKDKLSLTPSIVEKTAYTYRKVQEDGLIRGRTIGAVLVACLYITCREQGVSRTIDELAEASNIRRKAIAKIYRDIVFHLERKIPQVNCFQCIDKIANKIELNEITTRHARDLMKKVLEQEFSAGKDPMGFAGAVLYVSLQMEGKTVRQIDIADAAGVTEVTIRNRAKELKSKLHLI
ncbi:MAG: transcription initiation factor IIB [Thermoproteota archaeon]|jgi:transcription initiation factor TFIIB|nr:transcription initiation factor IIB [Thermoproteota archaeon]MDW0154826.1 transcription initiation factor IIB [Nitrososphaeraceae archaeon]